MLHKIRPFFKKIPRIVSKLAGKLSYLQINRIRQKKMKSVARKLPQIYFLFRLKRKMDLSIIVNRFNKKKIEFDFFCSHGELDENSN